MPLSAVNNNDWKKSIWITALPNKDKRQQMDVEVSE
ncbi:hypothetical protein T12_3142 [Trichinella patagoniensis]|uniref:Uncharacterized protein n=1 Tax=Trichinella patagoniensis TaxID=990121 RepID=A0A0V0ZJ30_9BILA|nr:hypothetical protein T12_3142 [Trichinella patagoniensis]